MITAQQAGLVPMQAGSLPATVTGTQLDINSITNLMLIMVVMVMMMKMMGQVTAVAK